MPVLPQGLEIEIQPAAELSPAEQAQIQDWLWQVFAREVAAYQWAEAGWHLRAWVGEHLVGHVDITGRRATVGGQPVFLGGVGGLVTLPGWRRQGIAAQMLQQVAQFLHYPLGVDFGLLVCERRLEPYYRCLGWGAVDGPLLFDQPGGKVTLVGGKDHFLDTVMVLPVVKTAWPAGIIDLCGLPW